MLIGLRVPVIKRNLGGIGVLIILAVALFLVFEYSFGIIKLIVTGLGKDMTFTDRVPLWNTLVDIGLRKPFLGYGYGGFWFGERLDIIEDFSIGHNGYLEIFVEGGLVAIILLIVLLISVLRTIQRL
jgi:O-antigen ligase